MYVKWTDEISNVHMQRSSLNVLTGLLSQASFLLDKEHPLMYSNIKIDFSIDLPNSTLYVLICTVAYFRVFYVCFLWELAV